MSRKFILTKGAGEHPGVGRIRLEPQRDKRLGCKLSTLKVRCSQERIRLSRRRRGPRELASQNQADHDQHGRRGTGRFHA